MLRYDKGKENVKVDIKELFQKLSSSNTKRNIFVVAGLLGIALIFASTFITPSDIAEQTDQTADTDANEVSEEYSRVLEQRLTEIISEIDGVDNVRIMITMDSTVEDIYAIEKSIDDQIKTDSDNGKSTSDNHYKEEDVYVAIKNRDGSESLVLLKQIMPKIRGVLVVCDGGDNTVVQEKVTKAVSSVLNISSGKVYVTN